MDAANTSPTTIGAMRQVRFMKMLLFDGSGESEYTPCKSKCNCGSCTCFSGLCTGQLELVTNATIARHSLSCIN
jgi:hypothetical protein